MAIQYIDGIRLYRTLTAGLHRVLAHEDYLNKINVFPVPDCDTGTNLAYTLITIKDTIHQKIHSNIQEMSSPIADSALDGARGNAGVILAQFLVGLSDGIRNKAQLTTTQFAAAARVGKQYAYEALVEPKEGTILTVMKDWAETLTNFSERLSDFKELLQTALEQARKSLADTPKKLQVLARAGVVDAGGQGFVDLLEGIQEFINDGTITKVDPLPTPALTVKERAYNEKYRYCTECIITEDNINRIKLKEQLLDHGNSIVLAGSKNKVKVHIHTDQPKTIMEICNEFGFVSGEKADDMLRQQKDAHEAHGSIAIVVDSTADLPDDILEEKNIHVVPVRLNFGERHYVDKMTMTSKEFWRELKTNPHHPKTSQPTPGDFRRQYQFLSTHYESAISIHIPAKVSGTFQSALTASKSLPNFPITIINGYNLSIGIGLITIRAAEAAEAGKTYDEILQIIDEAIKNTVIYIGLDTLTYAVRGGRVPKSKKMVSDLLHVHPILSMDNEGGLTVIGKTFGHKKKEKKFFNYVYKRLLKDKPYRVGLVHANHEEKGCELEDQFVKLIGRENVFFSQIGPALGTHAGPGALAIAIQTLEDSLNG